MALKNYTTKISASKTVGEIQTILAKHGARKVMIEYLENGNIVGITFAVDTPSGMRSFCLPAKVDAVYATLKKQRVNCDRNHAEKVAWRIIKDWIDAQMAILESEQVAFDEIFLPYMLDSQGNTMYDVLQRNLLPGVTG